MSLQQFWEALKEAIVAYTPATFFTLLALLVATYYPYVLFEPSDARHRPGSLEDEMQPPHDGKTTDEELMDPDPNKALVIGRDAGSSSCPYDVFLRRWGVWKECSRSPASAFRGRIGSPASHKGGVPKGKQSPRPPVSARKLAATLWEMNEVPSPRVKEEVDERRMRKEMRAREK